MAAKKISLLEIGSGRVHCVDGDNSSEIRSQFAREAEGLQLICKQLGKTLGTPKLIGCAVSGEAGGISFRYADSVTSQVDARGIYVSGESYTASSLMTSTEAGQKNVS